MSRYENKSKSNGIVFGTQCLNKSRNVGALEMHDIMVLGDRDRRSNLSAPWEITFWSCFCVCEYVDFGGFHFLSC